MCWIASQFAALLYGGTEDYLNVQLAQPFCCGTLAPTVAPRTIADGTKTEVTTQVIMVVVIICRCLYCPL